MPKLSGRKRKHLEWLDASPERRERIWERWRGVKTQLGNGTFRVLIGGKERVLKFSRDWNEVANKAEPLESLQEKNLGDILSFHQEAVRKGRIDSRLYELAIPKYLFSGRRVGVMEREEGVGYDTLKRYLDLNGQPLNEKTAERCANFLEKNPDLTEERAEKAFEKMKENVRDLVWAANRMGKNISYDFFGKDNVLVTGVNRKTGKIRLVLLDQISRIGGNFG